MRAHAKAVGNRLELLLLFVDAVARSPPPCLMHKRSVRRIHQTDDSVIHIAGQICAEVCSLKFVSERWNSRHFYTGAFAAAESRAWRPRIRNEYPHKTISLLASVIACINAIYLQALIRGERRKQLACLCFFGWQSAIPEAGEHSRIRHLIVEQIIGGHGITASVTQGACGSDTLVRSGRRVILRYRVDRGPGRTRMSDPYVASQISA